MAFNLNKNSFFINIGKYILTELFHTLKTSQHGFAVACAVKEDTLTDMVSCMSDTTGLVHQMPFVCDREGFSGVLEKVIFKYWIFIFIIHVCIIYL